MLRSLRHNRNLTFARRSDEDIVEPDCTLLHLRNSILKIGTEGGVEQRERRLEKDGERWKRMEKNGG